VIGSKVYIGIDQKFLRKTEMQLQNVSGRAPTDFLWSSRNLNKVFLKKNKVFKMNGKETQ
jgi:hypothetical protein